MQITSSGKVGGDVHSSRFYLADLRMLVKSLNYFHQIIRRPTVFYSRTLWFPIISLSCFFIFYCYWTKNRQKRKRKLANSIVQDRLPKIFLCSILFPFYDQEFLGLYYLFSFNFIITVCLRLLCQFSITVLLIYDYVKNETVKRLVY